MVAETKLAPSANHRPALRPRIHPVIERFLQDRALVHDLVNGFGSPLNVVFPENVDENIKSFQDAYKKNNLRGRIYFTSKPCKSRAIVRRASLAPIGIDVSSPASLKHALSCGFSTDRVEATGPKNVDYILTCLQLDVLLNADSIPELHMIETLHAKLGLSRKARVMVRLCGFESPRMRFTPQDNTFGIHTREIPTVIDWLAVRKDTFDFHGFSFYISGATVEQRSVAIENALELTFIAIKKGLKPRGLDIGGGFSIQYAHSPCEYDDYIDHLKLSILGKIENQIWNKGGLGFKETNGGITGAPLFINHGAQKTKGDELDHWVNQRSPQFSNATFADIIRDSLLELYIEPGRGMLDQCGITLGRVTHVKKSTWGETLVGLEMNRSNTYATNHKNLCAPVHIPKNPEHNKPTTDGVYYVGNLCVSYDMLQYNKTYPELMPERGDVMAFINTAPYAMDFVESETLMQPMAKKVALYPTTSGGFRWAADEHYLPIEV